MLLNKILLIGLFFSSIAQSNESDSLGGIKTEVQENKSKFFFSAGYSSLSYKGNDLSSISLGIGIRKAFSHKFAAEGAFNQAFKISGLSPIYSGADVRLLYAVTGTMIHKSQNVTLGSNQVLNVQEFHKSGIRVGVLTELYFFSSSASLVPFTGFGFIGLYEFPTTSLSGYFSGIRYDMISSSAVSLTPFQVFVGISF